MSQKTATTSCANGTCCKTLDTQQAVQCAYCHKASFCNMACMAEGFTTHGPCNTPIVQSDTRVPAVPFAWQSLASPAQWKTQQEAFPAYLAQHRNANGTVTQTVIPAVAQSASHVPKQRADDLAHVSEHSFSVRAEYLADALDKVAQNSVEYTQLLAPDHMIHTNSSDRRASTLASTRLASGYGHTYWVGPRITKDTDETRRHHIASDANGLPLMVPDTGAYQVPGMIRITLTSEQRDQPIVIEAPLVPMNDFDDQVRSKLGHHLRQHLQMQYKHKGLGSGKNLATYAAFNAETGARAILTFDRAAESHMAELVDMEVFVPVNERAVRFQKQVFRHEADARSEQDISAMVTCLEDRLAILQDRIQVLSKNNDDPENARILDLRDQVCDVQKRLATLEKHQKTLVTSPETIEEQGISASISAAIHQTMSELWEPIDARSQTVFDEIFKSGQWETEAYEETEALGRALIKRREELRQLRMESSERRGKLRRGVSNLRARYVRNQIKEKEKELTKLMRAAIAKKSNIVSTLRDAGLEDYSQSSQYDTADTIVRYIADVLAGRYWGTLQTFQEERTGHGFKVPMRKGETRQRATQAWGSFKDRFNRGKKTDVSWSEKGSSQQGVPSVPQRDDEEDYNDYY